MKVTGIKAKIKRKNWSMHSETHIQLAGKAAGPSHRFKKVIAGAVENQPKTA